MPELRSLVASAIQGDPETYTKVVLEQDPDDYCRWIQTTDAWGGAIEMGILSKHFDIEICSIDVKVRHPRLFPRNRTNQPSLCESTNSMKADQHGVFWYTQESTTTQSSKVPLIPHTPKQTTLLNSTDEYGTPTMMRSSSKPRIYVGNCKRGIITLTREVWRSGAIYVGLLFMGKGKLLVMRHRQVIMIWAKCLHE
jgi:hypothetical protein